MARKIKNSRSRGEAIISLAGLCAFAAFFLPPLRQAILGSDRSLVLTAAAAAGGLVLFFVVRKFTRKSNRPGATGGKSRVRLQPQRLRSFDLTTLEPVGSRPGSAPAEGAFADRGAGMVAVPNSYGLSAGDIIVRLRAVGWPEFEKVVALMYAKLGYTVESHAGNTGGIDLVIQKDGERTAVQCKQWKGWKVPENTVREFAEIMARAGMAKGVFIVLGGSPDAAKQLAEERAIEVLDEGDLAQMLLALDAHSDLEVAELLNC